ncbi:CHAP domain-containing protein [Sphaerisporangium melleum]|nr:CHAP domain-containing protein [Sphaerisporangium melleum]
MRKLLDLLRTQIGYSEQAGGYTKYGDWYGKNVEFDSDYSAQPWCDMFLSWAAHRLGYQKWFGQFAFTPYHAEWFVEQGAWGTTPEPGALVFYDWSGSGAIDGIDHVGIVTSVDGDTIHTIEGNIDGQYAREKVRDQTYVVGYGYPDKVRVKQEAQAKALAGKAVALKPVAAEFSLAPAMTATPGTAGDLAGGREAPGAAALLVPLLIAILVLVACHKARRALAGPASARPRSE